MTELRALFRGTLISELADGPGGPVQLSRGRVIFDYLNATLPGHAGDHMTLLVAPPPSVTRTMLSLLNTTGEVHRPFRPTAGERDQIKQWDILLAEAPEIAFNSRHFNLDLCVFWKSFIALVRSLSIALQTDPEVIITIQAAAGRFDHRQRCDGYSEALKRRLVRRRSPSDSASTPPPDLAIEIPGLRLQAREIATRPPSERSSRLRHILSYLTVNGLTTSLVISADKAAVVRGVCAIMDEVLIEQLTLIEPPSLSLGIGYRDFLSNKCPIDTLSMRTRSELVPKLLYHKLDRNHQLPFRIGLTAPFRSPELLEQSLAFVGLNDRNYWRSRRIDVVFTHSAARGAGVATEWLDSVLQQANVEANGLFSRSDDQDTLILNANASPGKLRAFGRLVGMALARDISPGLPLASGCLFWLMQSHSSNATTELPITLITEWAREVSDIAVQSNLRLRTDPDVLHALLGTEFPEEVVGDGARTLTEDNVEAFIDAQLRHMAVGAMRQASIELLTGIYDVLPYGQLEWLTLEEIRSLLSGPNTISIEELRATTTVVPADPRIEWDWFWETVAEFDQDQLGALLEFVSGSRRPPVGGFGGPNGDKKWLQLFYNAGGQVDGYPTSHTCYKQMVISRYTSKDVMRARLLDSVSAHNRLEVL